MSKRKIDAEMINNMVNGWSEEFYSKEFKNKPNIDKILHEALLRIFINTGAAVVSSNILLKCLARYEKIPDITDEDKEKTTFYSDILLEMFPYLEKALIILGKIDRFKLDI